MANTSIISGHLGGRIHEASALSILSPRKAATETATTKAYEHVRCHRSVEEQPVFYAALFCLCAQRPRAGIH